MISRGAGGKIMSVNDTRMFWSSRLKCKSPKKIIYSDHAADRTILKEVVYNCQNQTQFDEITLLGSGHTWPSGGLPQFPQIFGLGGKTSRELDSQMIWDKIQ